MQVEAPARPLPRALPVAAVLFDLDGTLADSAGDLAGAVDRIRRGQGLASVSVATLRPHAAAGARGLLGAGMGVTTRSLQIGSPPASAPPAAWWFDPMVIVPSNGKAWPLRAAVPATVRIGVRSGTVLTSE